MKMYRMLSFALLMSGLVHAKSVSVVNNSALQIDVQVVHSDAAVRKDGTCGREASETFKQKGTIGAGKSQTFTFSDCGKNPGFVVTLAWYDPAQKNKLKSVRVSLLDGQTVTLDKNMNTSGGKVLQ